MDALQEELGRQLHELDELVKRAQSHYLSGRWADVEHVAEDAKFLAECAVGTAGCLKDDREPCVVVTRTAWPVDFDPEPVA